jgi:hypothetical protein
VRFVCKRVTHPRQCQIRTNDAKAAIRAAVEYLLRGATGGARGDIVQEIIAIVRQVASGPEQGNPLDDGLPGG